MPTTSRRQFLESLAGITIGLSTLNASACTVEDNERIMTVKGPIDPDKLGNTLIHEHILVDFIGAKQYDPGRWNREEVIRKVLPFLKELKDAGCHSLADCTPNYLGRDVMLLKNLADLSGLNIITNTGYYGGSDNKYLPDHAFTESAEALATRWISEWENGIESSGVRPGFMKISVNPDTLTEISKKLIRAAALAHLQTGLAIASHTGPATPALEEIEILKKEGVHPGAFIWVHAQNETDWKNYVKAAREGAWVSLDGLNDKNVLKYVEMLSFMKKEKCLDRTLISHDAGWYEPGKPDGGNFRGYTTLFEKLLPALTAHNFDESEIHQLIHENPKNAFIIRIKRLNK